MKTKKSLKSRVNALEKQVKGLEDLKRLVLLNGRVGGKVDFVVKWLEGLLKEEGEITVAEVQGWADANGVSWTLMTRAKHKLGLYSVRRGKYFSWRKS